MRPYSHPEIRLAQQTKGFPLLSVAQRRLIVASILFQQRYDKFGKSPKYQTTSTWYNRINCHISVYMLEAQRFFGQIDNDSIPNHFFQASYSSQRITNATELDQFALSLTFPSVVHVSGEPKYTGGRYPVTHTLLALDCTSEGMIVWEKRGWCGEFRIATTEELIKDRPRLYWGARPLLSFN